MRKIFEAKYSACKIIEVEVFYETKDFVTVLRGKFTSREKRISEYSAFHQNYEAAKNDIIKRMEDNLAIRSEQFEYAKEQLEKAKKL